MFNPRPGPSERALISQHVVASIGLLIVIIAIGTLGYHIIEKWSFLDSLYMTVITITTIGFKEVHPMESNGIIFTIILSLAGVGTVAYALSGVVSLVVSGHLSRALRGRQMERDIKSYKNHVILCGCGRTGSVALQELLNNKEQVVVIEEDQDICETLREQDIPAICDDATHEDVLERARVQNASGLIASLPDDAANVFVALTAREMAPHLCIVARASEKSTESKLKRAGATRVVLANEVAGNHMADILLRPDAISFINTITGLHERNVGLREITISSGCDWEGKTLAEMHIREKHQLNILGIRRAEGTMTINPNPQATMNPGDVLIAFGPVEISTQLNKQFESQAHE